MSMPAAALVFFSWTTIAPVAFAWQSDLGDGRYQNPVLFADYSDPDVIRVGPEFYMVSSSFHFMPGIPVLVSKDLVNWQIIGHVYDHFNFDPAYDMTNGDRYAKGCWAPAIRYHDGRFWVYFPTPQEGIFMSTAKSAAGPWSAPVQVKKVANWEDPCPFWDDDGKAYLIHSVLGAGPLILNKMSADGTQLLDEGTTIVQDRATMPTLEGPKLYKMRGYYYIFAPAGGVGHGWQEVLRSTNIFGPYEHRKVLEQGDTAINGPHQGCLYRNREWTTLVHSFSGARSLWSHILAGTGQVGERLAGHRSSTGRCHQRASGFDLGQARYRNQRSHTGSANVRHIRLIYTRLAMAMEP